MTLRGSAQWRYRRLEQLAVAAAPTRARRCASNTTVGSRAGDWTARLAAIDAALSESPRERAKGRYSFRRSDHARERDRGAPSQRSPSRRRSRDSGGVGGRTVCSHTPRFGDQFVRPLGPVKRAHSACNWYSGFAHCCHKQSSRLNGFALSAHATLSALGGSTGGEIVTGAGVGGAVATGWGG